jgi:hypothetical protein
VRRASGALLASLALLLSGEAVAKPAEASWYADELRGMPTASGGPYDPDRYTAASPDLAIEATLLVTRGDRRVHRARQRPRAVRRGQGPLAGRGGGYTSAPVLRERAREIYSADSGQRWA